MCEGILFFFQRANGRDSLLNLCSVNAFMQKGFLLPFANEREQKNFFFPFRFVGVNYIEKYVLDLHHKQWKFTLQKV